MDEPNVSWVRLEIDRGTKRLQVTGNVDPVERLALVVLGQALLARQMLGGPSPSVPRAQVPGFDPRRVG